MPWNEKVAREVADVADVLEDLSAGEVVTVSPLVRGHDRTVAEYLLLRGAHLVATRQHSTTHTADRLPIVLKVMIADGVAMVVARTGDGFVVTTRD